MNNDLKELILTFKKEHKFLFAAIIISLVFAILPCLLCVFCFENDKIFGLFFFIPVIIVLIISITAKQLHKFFPKITSVITFLLNSFIIIFIQLVCGFIMFMLFAMLDADTVFDNPKYYPKALKSISYKNRIAHFPKTIPQNAKDIELYKGSSHWFGSEEILLKYTIDKNSIDNEIKKHKYIRTKTADNGGLPHSMPTDNGRIKLDGFTFYIINDRENENLEGHHFPYHYGIGVNNDTNQIIYYYTNPD